MAPQSVQNATQKNITPTGSPFAYTAPANGSLIINGGTVSAITLTRPGDTAVTLGQTGGLVSVQAGDVVTVTYSVAPTMTFLPLDRSSVGYLSTITKRVGPPSVGWQPVGVSGLPTGADVQVFAMYQETGTASTSGGPWYGTIWYVR
jgi:hypothetical protein